MSKKQVDNRFLVSFADLVIERSSDKRYNPNQPRHPGGSDRGGEWSGGGLSESNGTAPEVGKPFVVYRAGKPGNTGLQNRNAGNSLAVGVHLARLDDFDSPAYGGQAKDARDLAIHAYKITLTKPVGPFTRFNSGIGAEFGAAGFMTDGGNNPSDNYSFGTKGYHYEYLGSVKASDVMAELKARRSFTSFDDAGGQATAEVIREKLAPVVKRFNPNQPRDPAGTSTGGQWTSAGGTGGENDNLQPLTKQTKYEALVQPNEGKSLEQMHEEAFENQQRLRDIAEIIEHETGTEFDEPPEGYEVKTIESVQRKIKDEGYDGPHAITDHSRASFIVDTPEEGDAVVAALAQRGKVYDKGWKQIDEYGYLDRKVYMVHPNDGVSEIQITPRGVYQYKMGQGHRLYEIARKAQTPYLIARTAARKSRRQYTRLIRAEGFDAVLGEGK